VVVVVVVAMMIVVVVWSNSQTAHSAASSGQTNRVAHSGGGDSGGGGGGGDSGGDGGGGGLHGGGLHACRLHSCGLVGNDECTDQSCVQCLASFSLIWHQQKRLLHIKHGAHCDCPRRKKSSAATANLGVDAAHLHSLHACGQSTIVRAQAASMRMDREQVDIRCLRDNHCESATSTGLHSIMHTDAKKNTFTFPTIFR
jgi:hypothetical protein